MHKIIFGLVLGLIGVFPLHAQNDTIFIHKDIQLVHLKDSVFVHITFENSEQFGRFPSNGMIIIKQGQAIMVDTPMDNEKTERIHNFLKDSLEVELKMLIVGHFHDDCLGGLAYIQHMGIESVANEMTIQKCKELGIPVPDQSFRDSLCFDFNGEQVECRYFGGGHTFDNIVVWLPGKKILFGGCLIKSVQSRGLGNLTDAVVNEWDQTVERVLSAYKDIEVVIPGHGGAGGKELLHHTIELVEAQKRN